ncbi:MAG: hypothetical protein J5818_06620 [Eggerthellaceae bacterium]|nr:hypothetical protein [Eggerthellaceae bacterium]
MALTTFASVFALVALLGFLVLSAAKFAKYAKFNQHSRMDLYPVPKEGNGRGKYGGSYMEEDEWWKKERSINTGAEWLDIFKEMFFIRKLFVNQKSLWFSSFVFHGGIYVMMLWSILLLISAFVCPDWLAAVINVVGVIGFAAAGIGALTLLLRRIFDKSLAVYTTPVEYFNLVFILVVLATGAVAWLTAASPIETAKAVVSFNFAEMPAIVAVHLVLMGLMMLYIPASKMGHYAGKFFAFRSVMWNNEPNLPGSKVAADVHASNAAGASVTWSAHQPSSDNSQMEG